jgi:hypothetical protein
MFCLSLKELCEINSRIDNIFSISFSDKVQWHEKLTIVLEILDALA